MADVASTKQPVLVTKRGIPIVQVIPASDETHDNVPGTLAHTLIHMDEDIVSPVFDEWDSLVSRNDEKPV